MQVDDFAYLLGILSSDVTSNKDIGRRVGVAFRIVRNMDSVAIQGYKQRSKGETASYSDKVYFTLKL